MKRFPVFTNLFFYIYLCFHLFIYLGLHTVLENISALWWEETGDRGETFSNTSLLRVYERKENLTLYCEVPSVIFWGIRIYMHKKVFLLSVLVQKTWKKWSALYRGELQYFCLLITQGPCSLFQARQAYLGPPSWKMGCVPRVAAWHPSIGANCTMFANFLSELQYLYF